MSRSRKKHPVVTDTIQKGAKRVANKKIRNEDIGNGNEYKKHYCSWNICDYKFWVSKFDEFWNTPKWFRK